MPGITQESAHGFDLLLTITEIRRVDAVAGAIRSGRPGRYQRDKE